MQTRSRRALGDIGNLVRPPPQQGAELSKPPLTRRRAQAIKAAGAGAAAVKPPVPTLPIRKEKEPTLTAQLTARSEAACGFDAEMVDATSTPVAEEPLPNIDEHDVGNQLAVTDYVEDIYSFYRKAEVQSCAAPEYMKQQPEINDKMRAILVDWLIEVHLKFKLMPETLYLTINIIDRYLSLQQVSRKYLQLVGVTSMLIAAKYEEVWAPVVGDFVFISDDAYTDDQLLSMEKKMLNTLRFNLTVPTPYVFVVRFLKAAASDRQMNLLAFFFVELCLTEYVMLKYPPSMLAAAAVYAAQCCLEKSPAWTSALQRHSGYTEDQIRECATHMARFHQKVSKTPEEHLSVVGRKYLHTKFGTVAALTPPKSLLLLPQ
ncbi:hypothetical protein SELMODRAFT_230742 [Selaginella moellendorffii]|uniref:Uncharacterized protein CYCB1-1 n=1 Tax=Selaginella moellendorffii TaxID=88036 RepID=D8R4N3_SELML|nr:G2/mitotic-specific cyclin S13-7 [Selaginella moellendorffii]XP_002971620.1 G2/mitotic-specific cyclin S13-7 [Selaginella moellendorffii]EFJ27369.1 hypothetical protein SELMODRAFT_231762 [Selaginella moellendorffii]EFJ33131.1 hypothetical protein SELMODRAFT_230742 [Selaginella moellendorffii]|eukprot:XP_002965711.1 G2/mitotic-specific cyclin S13-7 [Selaginella moellendorffii]